MPYKPITSSLAIGDYFTLEMGLLFTTDYYVPTSVVSRIEGDKVYLKISADEVKSSGWQDPPLGYERGEQFREHLTETPAAQVDEPQR